MLFNSFQFLTFLVVTWSLFQALKGVPRKALLLGASYYFYMCWSTKYILVIWAITLIDFAAGRLIERSKLPRLRTTFLVLSIFCNLGLLVIFKYFNFLSTSTAQLLHSVGLNSDPPLLHVILPVGLSFHTFQAMSYTIDVYKKKAAAERSLLNYALYVAFFPQMVAGPIERPNQLLPQFHHDPTFRPGRVRSGIKLALWGLFKKMVIADALAGFVNLVYANPQGFSGAELTVATLAFSLQIYCDFSGYSDIALGVARMMGYELRVNFLQPYFSRSIGEFWHRWHVSLSTWFRDYVYIPLGGNRVAVPRHYINLLVTFLISGLWHGANWTFVIWGGLHGSLLVLSQLTSSVRARAIRVLALDRMPKSRATLQWLWTFTIVTVAWIAFRAKDIRSAWYVVTHLSLLPPFNSFTLALGGIPRANTPFLVLFIVTMFAVEWWIMHPHRTPGIWSCVPVRWACYYGCAFSIVFFGVFGHTDFIYFQF
jgi:D-alanyl-lipoteichoic acid acyltransferase DltB (MBOAT superfamily)